jgi:hypothetical protein
MNFKNMKEFCDEKIKEYPEFIDRYKKEIFALNRFEKNGRDIYKEFENKKDEIDNRYVIPYLLGFTNFVDLTKPLDMVQVRCGASGGIDIDSDFSAEGKEEAFNYLSKKYGEERVMSVGTYSRMGMLSAVKDLLRLYKVPFSEMNDFSNSLNNESTWEENITRIKNEDVKSYTLYKKYKEILSLVPVYIGKVRQLGRHAGGIILLDRPIYELIPVERVSGQLATAFPESGSEQVLDEIGIVKLDILGISILNVIQSCIENVDEDIFLIEEDGIRKIVPASYLEGEEIEEEQKS